MSTFPVPTRSDVSDANRAIFDRLEKQIGFVPNLYATLAHSDDALASYLALQGAKSSLSAKAKEVVNLAVSEANGCDYCLAAHTAIGRMTGFDDAQILEIRAGGASFDPKLDALARFARSTVEARGKPAAALADALLAAGWSTAQLVDAIVLIGEMTVTNYLHGVTGVAIDFPAAPALDRADAA